MSNLPMERSEVGNLSDLQTYLKDTSLEYLMLELRENGITQKAFAESIGMNPRHLSYIKSSELRNPYHNELGVTKLGYLWVPENLANP